MLKVQALIQRQGQKGSPQPPQLQEVWKTSASATQDAREQSSGLEEQLEI